MGGDILNDGEGSILGVLLHGGDESGEERSEDGGNLGAAGLQLVEISIKVDGIFDQSNGVGVSGVQISKGLVDISKKGDVGALIDISDVVNLEKVVETFKDLTGGAGGVTEVFEDGPVADSGGSDSDKDGEKDELVHLIKFIELIINFYC